ncbi:MAG TPA: NAD-dependent epimerase/dehydratase family protein [Chthoniobacterales bacterium]
MQANPDFWRGRQVAVIGGTGFLGWHIVRQLVELGARVRVLALPPRADHPIHKLEPVELVIGDLRDAASVRHAIGGCDIVFNAAGVVAFWGAALKVMDDVHRRGTLNVLAAAAKARLIHVSSIVTIGATRDGNVLDENSPFTIGRLRVDYVRTKRVAEELVLAAKQDVVVTNPGYLVGPDDPELSMVGRFCRRYWRGRIPVAPPGGYNLADVRDVATGHLLAAEHGVTGKRYILGGENHTVARFLQLLAAVAEWRPRAFAVLPQWMMGVMAECCELRSRFTQREAYPSRQAARLLHYFWYVSSDRASRELSYSSRPLAATIEDTYSWYIAQGISPLHGFNRWWLRPAG